MKIKNRLALIAAVVSVAIGANLVLAADPSVPASKGVCDTVDTCKALIDQANTRLAELLKGVAPSLTDIARDAHGQILHLTQNGADKYCREKGMRLPTQRELALTAQSMGAEGISETEKEGFYLVEGSASNGVPDYFYFSNKGYQRPQGDLGSLWFWSSWPHPRAPSSAFFLDGYDGDFNYAFRSTYSNIAVRCAR